MSEDSVVEEEMDEICGRFVTGRLGEADVVE
jgi:hypothetical protein